MDMGPDAVFGLGGSPGVQGNEDKLTPLWIKLRHGLGLAHIIQSAFPVKILFYWDFFSS